MPASAPSALEALAERSATVIARALAAGAASPVALAELCLERIARQASPAFLSVTPERALAEARAAEARLRAGRPASALDGVPIGWKDLIDLKGAPTTAGSDLLKDVPIATRDAPAVTSASAAGLVSLGKLNMTEFAYSGLGLNPHVGTPVNPLSNDEPRAPGGSSSGSAVAVASGLCPCAMGTDTGGSVRIPAAFNGLVGYKASAGRTSNAGVVALSPSFDSIGPLARSVEDCIHLEAAFRGVASAPIARADPAALRFHVPEGEAMEGLEPEVAENFEAAIRRCEAAGVTVTRAPLAPIDEAARLTREIGTIASVEAYLEHRTRIDGPEVARMDRRVVARILRGKRMSAADLLTLQRARVAAMAALPELIGDALIAMPTTPHVAPEIGPLEADDTLFDTVNLKTLRNTAIGSFLDTPGLAIPNGTGVHGLPTSILISVPRGQDAHLLGAGLALEPILRG